MLVENRLAVVGVVFAVLTLALFVEGVREVSRQQFRERPDPDLTPGQADTLSVDDVCPDRHVPQVAASIRKSVFDRYGIDRPSPENYELDFLTPPNLGGAADTRNLWPQPLKPIEWNAHIKDALEKRLHELVCSRTIPLTEAQNALTTDWIAAYQQYFHARLPLTVHRRP